MTLYHYVAQGADGRRFKGTVDAASREAAARLVSKGGQRLLDISEHGPAGGHVFKRFSLSRRNMLGFRSLFSELSILLEAGFTIDAALRALAATRKKGDIAAVVDAMAAGKAFSEAARGLAGADEASIALLISGEHSGRLSEVVSILSRMFEEDRKRSSEALEALVYPAFLVVMMLAATGIITFALVPAIDPVFDGMDQKRPASIAMLASLRLFLLAYGWTLLAGLVTAAAAMIAAGRTVAGRRQLSVAVLKVPLFGSIVSRRGCARYLYVLGMLLENGVGVKRALGLAAKACPVSAYRERLLAIQESVGAGAPLRTVARTSRLFDATTLSLIEVGDEANRLPDALKRAAFLLDSGTARAIQRMLMLLTPTVTVAMGLAIGGIVLSLMDALLSINDMALQ
ncbi:type II secretion system F family protein [Pararhizobium gei]|uniref:type II secretion system F family protein n=1 Tax=Pararhizobium gei TaxID=1395951 RepID=UPI0023DBD8BB|nr:type II secretion system F family protein [Rhizobium gei]